MSFDGGSLFLYIIRGENYPFEGESMRRRTLATSLKVDGIWLPLILAGC